MTENTTKDTRHWEVKRFGNHAMPEKYRGTWYWDAGYIMGQEIGFPMFEIRESSHGYRKGTLKKRKGPYSRKGPVIKTKTEAIRQAKAAMAKLKIR
jgi:hypothetical protein